MAADSWSHANKMPRAKVTVLYKWVNFVGAKLPEFQLATSLQDLASGFHFINALSIIDASYLKSDNPKMQSRQCRIGAVIKHLQEFYKSELEFIDVDSIIKDDNGINCAKLSLLLLNFMIKYQREGDESFTALNVHQPLLKSLDNVSQQAMHELFRPLNGRPDLSENTFDVLYSQLPDGNSEVPSSPASSSDTCDSPITPRSLIQQKTFLQKQMANMKTRLAEEQQHCVYLDEELISVKNDAAEIKEKYSQLKHSHQKLQDDLQEYMEFEALANAHKHCEGEKAQLQGKIEKLRKTMQDLREQELSNTQEVREYKEMVAKLNAKFSHAQSSLKKLTQERNEYQELYEAEAKEHEMLKATSAKSYECMQDRYLEAERRLSDAQLEWNANVAERERRCNPFPSLESELQIDELQTEIATMKNTWIPAEEYAKQKRDLAKAHADIMAMKNGEAEKDMELARRKKLVDECKHEMATEHEDLTQQNKGLQEQLKCIQKEMNGLAAGHQETKKQLEAVEQQKNKIAKDLQRRIFAAYNQQHEHNVRKKQLEATQQKNVVLEKEVQGQRVVVTKHQCEIKQIKEEYEHRISTLQQDNSQLSQLVSQSKSMIRTSVEKKGQECKSVYNAEIKRLCKVTEKLRAELNSKEEDNKRLKDEIAKCGQEAKSRVENVCTEVDNIEEGKEMLLHEMKELKRQKKDLEDQIGLLEGSLRRAKAWPTYSSGNARDARLMPEAAASSSNPAGSKVVTKCVGTQTMEVALPACHQVVSFPSVDDSMEDLVLEKKEFDDTVAKNQAVSLTSRKIRQHLIMMIPTVCLSCKDGTQ